MSYDVYVPMTIDLSFVAYAGVLGLLLAAICAVAFRVASRSRR